MHRFYLPPEHCQSPPLSLQGAEAHHGLHVLRVRKGERVTVLDGQGHEFLSEVVATGRKTIELKVLKTRPHPQPPCRITLLQALPKGKLIETIIHKATELGASRIVPLLTERVIHKFNAEEGAEKAEKWQQVAIEAIKQCGMPWLPRVESPVTPQDFLSRQERFELPLLASLRSRQHPRAHFDTFRATHSRQPASACTWIGPEGDFTPGELAAIEASGALPITLGPLTLRTDTAANYCLSFIQYEVRLAP